MGTTLATAVKNIQKVANIANRDLITKTHNLMQLRGLSPTTITNNLKAFVDYAIFLGNTNIIEVNESEVVYRYLNTKLKSEDADPDRRSFRTWNDSLDKLRNLYTLIYDNLLLKSEGSNRDVQPEGILPKFISTIRRKKLKSLNPYTKENTWEWDELLLAVKYENDDRNKAIFTMTWDANGRPHEIKKIKVNQINLEDNYGEGDIPVNTKTGTRDFNIAGSYPYIRNYLNELPLKSEPNAFLFQSHKNGAPLHSDTMTALFKHLRRHIIKLLDTNKITDEGERNKLQAIVRNKIWNMYCLRHSALTDKFDVLERGELIQIAGWSPNTKQDKRYIKSRVSRNTKRKLLHQAGIITKQEADPEPRTNICPCGYTNTHEAARCVKCNFALGYKGWKAAKQNEEQSARELRHRMEEEIELEFESRLTDIQNNFSKQQEEEMNRRNVDQERLARIEKVIEVMANGKATFEMKKNGASKDMTLIPMQEFIFDKNLTHQELETQVREILLSQRKPNGPVEYRIVPKNMKPNALVLGDKQSMDSGIVISPTS